MTRLRSSDFDSHILQVDPKFFEKEKQYEERDKAEEAEAEAREAKQAKKLKKTSSISSSGSIIESSGMEGGGGLRKQRKLQERRTEVGNRAELEQIMENIHEQNEK